MKKILLFNFIPANTDIALFVLRIWMGFGLFAKHGIEKFSNFSQMQQHFPDPIHIGSTPSLVFALLSDGICSLLVIFGFATRLASFVIVVNLFIVFLEMHQFSFAKEHAELVYLFLGGFLAVFIAGAGKYSIDHKIGEKFTWYNNNVSMKRIIFLSFVFQMAIMVCDAQDTAAIRLALGEKDYKDYQDWVGLGIGGIPHTLEGYRIVKMLNTKMKDPLDITRVEGDIGKPGDISTLIHLPKRKGVKPLVAPFAVPHRQMDQHNDTVIRALEKGIFDAQVADPQFALIYKTSYLERNSPGIFLKDSASGNPFIVPVSHAEIGHIHMFDGSMHIILSPSDTKEVIEKGWGELHGLAGQGHAAKTYMMIYAPRTKQELKITRLILLAAVKYAVYYPGK